MSHSRLASLCILVLAACGVPKDEHQKTVDQLAQIQNELQSTKAERDKLQAEKDKFAAETKKVSGELTNASNRAVSLEQDVAASKAELESLRKQRAQYEQRMQAFKDLALKLKAMVDAGKLQVQFRKGRMLVRLPDNILFPVGSAKLKKEGEAAIAEVATALSLIKDRDFVVAGHTDNVGIKTGRFPSNWELSSQRAIEVAKFMIGKGVDPAHISAAGYAEHDPVVANDTPENKQANRRIEIIVMPKIEELPQIDEKT